MIKKQTLIILFLTFSLLGLWISWVWAKPISMKEAETLYLENCSVCHGDKGDANTHTASAINPSPRNFTTPQARSELSYERMIRSVSNGRPGTAMQPFKNRLTPEEIAAIVKYIRVNFMKLKESSSLRDRIGVIFSTLDPTSKAYAEETSSLKRGESLYQANCSVCHGDKGNGKSWAAKDLNPPPKNFTDPETIKILSRERMIRSISEGRPKTAMQPFKSQLSPQEINLIVDYIRATFMKIDISAEKKKG